MVAPEHDVFAKPMRFLVDTVLAPEEAAPIDPAVLVPLPIAAV